MLGIPAIGEKIRGIKYKFYGGSEDIPEGQEDVRRVEEDEWRPVISFSKRGRGGRGRGKKGERGGKKSGN